MKGAGTLLAVASRALSRERASPWLPTTHATHCQGLIAGSFPVDLQVTG